MGRYSNFDEWLIANTQKRVVWIMADKVDYIKAISNSADFEWCRKIQAPKKELFKVLLYFKRIKIDSWIHAYQIDLSSLICEFLKNL